MAGANYMGGRRNAVKAQIRDTDGKLQKSHFGKQRLNILAKGLGKTLNIASTSSRPGPPPGSSDRDLEISLAHAKRPSVSTFSFKEDNSRLSLPAYIEVPSASTKTAKKASSSRTGSSPSSRSSTSRSSKILQELDMTEPICFRAEVNRLLAHPDFAGLADKKQQTDDASEHRSHNMLSRGMTPEDIEPEWIHASSSSVCARTRASPNSGYMEYHEPLADEFASYSDFEPMPFDEDSGYAEDIPVKIRPSHSPASEPTHDRAITGHLREGVVFDSPYCLAPSQQHGYLYDLEANRRPTSTSAFARSSEPSGHYVSGFEGRRDLDLPSSLQPIRYSENSADVPREPSFLERMTAKYPYLSASISSGVSSPRTGSSVLHYANPSRLLSPFDELDLPDFISDIASKPRSPTEAADEVAATTLLDAVEGRLFEGSDPWKAIRERLSCSPAEIVVSTSTASPTTDGFHELQNATNRRGVGFRESQPRHPPHNPHEDRNMQDTLASSDDPPSHATPCSVILHPNSRTSSHDSRSNAPTPKRSLLDLSPLTSLSSSELRAPIHEDPKSLDTPQLLALSADHFFITPNVDNHHQSPHDTLGSRGASLSIAAKSSSTARRLAELHVHCVSPIRKEPASLQELPSIKRSPLMVHSSPRIACIAPSSGSVSASAGLPENTSAGDVEEGQRGHRQADREDSNSIVPIQSTPKETFVAGPLLFDDELENGDDM